MGLQKWLALLPLRQGRRGSGGNDSGGVPSFGHTTLAKI